MRNRIQHAFDSVKASEEQKQALQDYLRKQRQKAAPKRTPVFMRAAVALSAFLICLAFAGLYLVRTTAYTVHIDTSPAVSLDLNRFDKVISVTASAPESTALLDELSVEGLTCPEAVDVLLDAEALQASLAENPEPSVTVEGRTEEQSARICSGIQRQMRARRGKSETSDSTGNENSSAVLTEAPTVSSAAPKAETPHAKQGAANKAGQAQSQTGQAQKQKQLRRHGKS